MVILNQIQNDQDDIQQLFHYWQMIEENQRALLAWVSQVQKTKFYSFKELWNGEVFHSLMKKIQNLSITEFKQSQEEQSWTFVLNNLNKLYKDLAAFYRQKLYRLSFDNNFANVLQIAQNKDSLQIYNFCLQIFGAAVQARNKQGFIYAIIQLQTGDQQTLQSLIQTFHFGNNEESVLREEDNSFNQKKILLAKVQSLQNENEKYQKQIQAILQQKKGLEQKCNRLQDDYNKISQEYQNKLFELDNIPQSQIKLGAHMQELNGVLLEQLRGKLLDETSKNNKQKAEMQDTIDFLKQKIQLQQQQLQNPDRNGVPVAINAISVPQHPACISLTKHKQLILAQSTKMKQIMKKEMDSSIQNLNLKKQIEMLNRQIDKMKNQFIKKSDAINRDDYDAVKLNILQLLRDKFKTEAQKHSAKQ